MGISAARRRLLHNEVQILLKHPCTFLNTHRQSCSICVHYQNVDHTDFL